MPDSIPPAPARPAAPAPRRRRWLAAAAITLGVLLLLVCGARAWHEVRFARLVASGQIQVETLRGWMTLPYIAHLYGVPEARLREAIGAPPQGGEERSMLRWFLELGLDPLEGRRRIEAIVLAARRGEARP